MVSISYVLQSAQHQSILKKCFPVVLCCLYLLFRTGGKDHYSQLILLGLIFSLGGDACLIYPNLFIPGMALFAGAHVCYILAFGWHPLNWTYLLFILPLEGIVCAILLPNLDEKQKIFVPIYMMLLGTMVWRAVSRKYDSASGRYSAIGGVSFMVSDCVIGLDTFVQHVSWSSVFIMTSYYIAQILITLSATEL
ncbi:lysoplasmalogenase-like [Erpetoichthys calabaricus]|uniref:lysoplasmalogenase n=1 Tax=Erpetoichthys calabaricus TaxID=27687 RepID=A0A8C4S4A8_ERPCA|nr:lysoplasmalogenase-like [Erpetoichthys calabaricus]